VAGDVSPLVDGDIWYNSVARKIRGVKTPAGAWASGGNINTGRAYGRNTGIQTACIYFGGHTALQTHAITEEYDGSSWTETGDLNATRKSMAGFGTSTAAVAAGGDLYPSPTRHVSVNEEWNGSTWAEVTDLPTTKAGGSGAGIITAGLVMCGTNPGDTKTTFEYDGTNWTDGGDSNSFHSDMGYISAGTQTAGLIAGGGPGPTANCELYNGTAWTEVNNLNTASNQGGGGGTQTSAIAGGSQQAPQSKTESWDGTSWSELADISTGRYGAGGCAANNTSAVMNGGYISPSQWPTGTEEWNVVTTAETVAFD
jgi:hypothetical protein